MKHWARISRLWPSEFGGIVQALKLKIRSLVPNPGPCDIWKLVIISSNLGVQGITFNFHEQILDSQAPRPENPNLFTLREITHFGNFKSFSNRLGTLVINHPWISFQAMWMPLIGSYFHIFPLSFHKYTLPQLILYPMFFFHLSGAKFMFWQVYSINLSSDLQLWVVSFCLLSY